MSSEKIIYEFYPGALDAAFGPGAALIKSLLGELSKAGVLRRLEKGDGNDSDGEVPYEKIIELYHTVCKSYPRIRGLSERRKRLIAGRWHEHRGDFNVFNELFLRAEESKFLKGENSRHWMANFDWMLEASNMWKVLEGRYKNYSGAIKEEIPQGGFDTDEFFSAAIERGKRFCTK